MPQPEWIGVDWGTTHLRAWAVAGDQVLAEAVSDNGMGSLEPGGFEAALLDLIDPWLGGQQIAVLVCGMAGSRQGWCEAPYRAVPCTPLGAERAVVETCDRRISVAILPGLKQLDPADVMRGEETQIAGFLALNHGFDGVLCLPGTHTKWAQISAQEVVSFRTFMTGEMYALLGNASVLRHTLGDGWDGEAFAEAVSDAMSNPALIAARLFGLRAGALVSGLAPDTARARLSGLLIGAELAGARPYWLGQQVAIIGAAAQGDAYAAALAAQGLDVTRADADEMTRAGLTAARAL